MNTFGWAVLACLAVVAVSELLRANAEQDRADEAEARVTELDGKYRESVARESLHLMGPLALYGPLEPSVESTPIADALDFGRWESEMGDR